MLNYEEFDVENYEDKFGIHPFYVKKGSERIPSNLGFAFASPTTKVNTLKVLRALQLKKPILLEGSPGVGKTSLVSALARASGHRLLRLNLSDQTVSIPPFLFCFIGSTIENKMKFLLQCRIFRICLELICQWKEGNLVNFHGETVLS